MLQIVIILVCYCKLKHVNTCYYAFIARRDEVSVPSANSRSDKVANEKYVIEGQELLVAASVTIASASTSEACTKANTLYPRWLQILAASIVWPSVRRATTTSLS